MTATEKVTWSEGNPSQQPRPRHSPECWQANRSDKRRSSWSTGTLAEAEKCSRHGLHDRRRAAAVSNDVGLRVDAPEGPRRARLQNAVLRETPVLDSDEVGRMTNDDC